MSQTHAALRERLQAALGDEFTVGEPVGEGGFAVVFRAKDNALNRDVAVKVLDLKLVPSPSLAERFIREARTVARLEHPHIVPIYKVGGRGEVLYLIMRLVDGPSVRELLERQGPLSLGDAARIARQVADALGYAHTHGIVHRDVKPDNILLDRMGHVLVTDFGIAKAAAQAAQAETSGGQPHTTEGMILGTPQYMSPEQVAGDTLDGRSDIYSLGLVLYYMLTGQPPFDGDSAQEILAKQLTADAPPIRAARRDVPDQLAAVLDRMLAKSAAHRHQSAVEVSRALVEALPTAAHDRVAASLGERLQRSLVRLGLVGCLAFAAFVAGGTVVALTLLSESAAIAVRGPGVPDSVLAALRRAGALAPGERPLAVFAPHGATLRSALVVTSRSYVRPAAPRLRTYSRASTDIRFRLRWGGSRGLRGIVILQPRGARPDTLSRDLSPRELLQLFRLL